MSKTRGAYILCFETEIRQLPFGMELINYGTTFRHACCTMVNAPHICIWNQHSFNGLLTVYGTISFPDIDHGFLQTFF